MNRTKGAILRPNQRSTMSVSALSDADLRRHLFDRLAERLEAAAGRDSALTFRQRSPTAFSLGRNGNLLVVDQGEGMRLMRGEIQWKWTPDQDEPFTFSVARSVHGQSLQMIPVGPEGDVDAIVDNIVQTFLTRTQAP